MARRYEVEVLPDPPDMPAEHRARFKICLERRLGKLEDKGKAAKQGDSVDILDNFSGKYVWEMSAEELEKTPPSSVELTIDSMETNDGVVPVVARARSCWYARPTALRLSVFARASSSLSP
jgi:hypothetical protein